MKFNWGTGIALFFIFFAVSMIAAVMATTKHPPQMVQKDYYALDLNYQERLERKQHTAELTAPPSILVDSESSIIRVKFPEGMSAQNGAAKCYRSASTRDDFTVKIENTAQLDIPADKLPKGRWHIELEWEDAAGKKYFWEQAIAL